MYTLEDDQETSERLRKGGPAQEPAPSDGEAGRHSPLEQISSSLKKITAPATGQAGNRRIALAALTIACIGVFFTALDQTVVVTALPQIITDLQIPITQIDHAAWIVSAYLLGFVIAMPLMGRVSDLYGRRRIFLLCLAIFAVGSIFCGLAPFLGQNIDLSFLSILNIDTSTPGQAGLVWLIAARFFQAIGGGAIVPVAMAVASDFYGEKQRGLALGVIGAVTEAGGAIGPLYGALIVEHLGWQAIFYLNVPIVLGLAIGAWFLIPRGTRLREAIDWLGTLALGAALTCLSLGLAQQGAELGPPTPGTSAENNPVLLALALVLLVVFVLIERKVRHPVIDLSLFKRLPFSATALVSLFVGAALIIAMADIPIFVDTVLQRPVIDSGLALLRLTMMIPLGAILGGWLCGQISCRLTAVLGLLFTAAGFYLMSLWPLNVGWTQITISTMTAGLGFGLVIAPIGTTAINAVRKTQTGMGSSIVTALRMVGMMLGLAALTSWALAYFKELASTYPSLPLTATAAQFAAWSKGYAHHLVLAAHTVYSAVFFAAMVLSLVALVPAIFLWGRKAPEEEPDVAAAPALAAAPEAVIVPEGAQPDAAEAASVTQAVIPAPAPTPGEQKGRRGPRWWRERRQRRRVLAIGALALALILVLGGILAALSWQNDTSSTTGNPAATSPASGPRLTQLALSGPVLSALLQQQLGAQPGGLLSNLKVTLQPNNGLRLNVDLHIDTQGIHRVMPVELDSILSLDKQQNITLRITHLKRDGRDAPASAVATMQRALDQLLQSSVMPALHGQLKNARLLSLHTTSTLACSKGQVVLVLLVEAPPVQGVAAQPTPGSFCLTDPAELNKFFGQ